MYALNQVTQTQEEIMSELNTTGFIDEPSQSELEEELSDILSQNTPTRKSTARSGDDSDIERELNEILNDSNADVGISGADSYKDEGLSELLAGMFVEVFDIYVLGSNIIIKIRNSVATVYPTYRRIFKHSCRR